MRLNKITLAGLVLCGSVFLTACGGDSDSSGTPVAQANTQASISPATGESIVTGVLGKTFDFSSGVAAFGTTADTKLTLTGTGAAPSFAITSGADSATGRMTYGSCIFNVTKSTFLTGPLVEGNVFPVNPCALTVDTAGKAADGTAVNTNVNLLLGATTSSPVAVTATISPDGTVSVNGSKVGSVTVVAPTGAGN